MLEHEIKNKVLTIGNRKGQTVYYAYPKSQQKLTNDMVVERIVRETSLSEGDVKNALISLSDMAYNTCSHYKGLSDIVPSGLLFLAKIQIHHQKADAVANRYTGCLASVPCRSFR